MTAKQHATNLRLRGCLLALRKLNADNPAEVREVLRRIRSSLRACEPETDTLSLARQITIRLANLALRA